MWESDAPELPRSTWRLLNTGAHDGATNMAIDEAIMLAVSKGHSLPTVRFYSWQPPCVSVGYAQSLQDEIDLDACLHRGYTWVRRPTGGRAVLHIDEITYSVTALQEEPRVAGDILASYQRLSWGLMAGLRLLGCDVWQAEQQVGTKKARSAACFDVPSHYEVTASGRKLIGSAQVRRRGVVLQHGALPLRGDVSRLVDVLALPKADRDALRFKLRSRAIALEEALGRSVALDEVVEALIEGFSQVLNLELVPGVLSDYERGQVVRSQSIYAGDEWTFGK
jgi:lipoate-protein ligase A